MSIKNWPGGRISSTPPTPSGPFQNSTASGVWTLDQVAYWRSQNQWPTSGNIAPDPDFEYVTMLLHGDGTNGAQNNTFLDSSTNNFTITRNGNTTQGSFSPYGPNWSNYFNGSDTSLITPSSSALQINTGDFSVEAFVFPQTQGSGDNAFIGSFVQLASPGDHGIIFGYQTSFGATDRFSVLLKTDNSTSIVLTASSTSTRNQWHHVVVCRSGSTVSLFVDGTRLATGTYSATLLETQFSIGRLAPSGYAGGYFGGYVSNVRIIVGASQYSASSSTITVPTSPLTVVSNTQLLTCADNRFIDDSTNNFALTVVGAPSVQRFSPFSPTTAYSTATIGGSGYFDGSGDWLTSSASSQFAFGTGNFTMEAYVYVTGGSGYRQIYSTRQGVATGGSVAVNPSGGLTYYDSGFVIDYTTPIPTQQWIHVALARSGSTIRLFLNGVQIGSASNSTNLTSTDFAIGANVPGDERFVGYISNVRVVKGTAVYTSNFTPPTAPVTAIANTSLLCNFTNGAIFDNAMMNDLETVGNAQISTSVVKYGTGSISFNGTNSNLLGPISQNTVFPGNFTVEFWVYKNADKDFNVYFDNRATVGSATGFSIASNSFGQFALFTNNSFTIISNSYATATWFHIAVVRSGSTITLYVNGVSVGTSTNSTAFTDGRLGIGYSLPDSAQYVNGYIDDMRITKGVARYTTNFTPPTAAFPDI